MKVYEWSCGLMGKNRQNIDNFGFIYTNHDVNINNMLEKYI